MVGAAGEVPVSAPGVTCAALALMGGQDLLRTMEKWGLRCAPFQQFGAAIPILYHSWQLSASPQKSTRAMDISLAELPRFPVV